VIIEYTLQMIGTKNLILLLLVILWTGMSVPTIAADKPLTGDDVVKRCGIKYPGDDQRSKFEVLLRDKQNNEKKSLYIRLWKDYKGVNKISDKMLLFTEFPPDAQGSAFMRTTYVPELEKSADQWIYLPVLRKIRRVTIRDLGDSFLNSDLTYADIRSPSVNEDNHKLLDIKELAGVEFYVVESVPKKSTQLSQLYSKRIQWFNKASNWDDCANVRIDYYDLKGGLLKEQFIKWQRVNSAWVWDRVLVRNVQTLHASIFLITDVQINTGLNDDVFSERTLRTGPSAIPDVIQKPIEK